MSKVSIWKRITPVNFQVAGVAITAILVLAGVLLGLQQIDQKTSPLRIGGDEDTTLILKVSDKTNTNKALQNVFNNPSDQAIVDFCGDQVTPLDRNSTQGSDLFRIEGNLQYYEGQGGNSSCSP